MIGAEAEEASLAIGAEAIAAAAAAIGAEAAVAAAIGVAGEIPAVVATGDRLGATEAGV